MISVKYNDLTVLPSPEIIGLHQEIILFYGRKIQISELFSYTQIEILSRHHGSHVPVDQQVNVVESSNGWTPLFVAVRRDFVPIIRCSAATEKIHRGGGGVTLHRKNILVNFITTSLRPSPVDDNPLLWPKFRLVNYYQLEPHKAVAEVSNIGHL